MAHGLAAASASYQGRWGSMIFRVRTFPGGITISLGLHARVQVYTYEASGRPWTFIVDGRIYRRALNGTMLVKWRPPGQPRQRTRLNQDEALQVEAAARKRIQAFTEAWDRGALRFDHEPPPRQVRTQLDRILAWDATRSRADAQRYTQVYKPIGILPPDQYLAVVVQITEGCSFNTCTFCTFYRDRPFRIKGPDEVRAHIAAIRDYLGPGLPLRHGVFLGDANALVAPMPRLRALLAEVRRGFPEPGFRDLYAFLDGFSGERKRAEDYAALAAYGLRRVYIGLESGHAPLLRFLRKPGTPEDALAAVRAMKAGGLAVGVIVLLGAGGKQYATGHVRDTIRVVNAMGLGPEDILYFSELVVEPDMPYAREALRAGIEPLTPEEQRAQQAAIVQGLRFPQGRPRISRYDIREFVY
ncbi:MAG: radical SAM protein [Chloroflexi bacterium]|nr:radical SAM protein [Chloroflexota bacterium]